MTECRSHPASTGRRWLGPALAFLLVLATPAVLLAHLHLRHSAPAPGALLHEAPSDIRLTFSEAPQLAVTSVALTDSAGARVVLGPLRIDSRSAVTLVVPITGALHATAYTVSWSTTSDDGHPVRGHFGFRLATGAEGLATSTMGAPATGGMGARSGAAAEPAPAPPAASSFDVGSPAYVAIRTLTFVAALIVVGAAFFLLAVAPRLAAPDPGSGNGFALDAARAAARLGLFASVALVIAQVARLAAQSWAVRGAALAFRPALLGSLITGTVWGRAWVWGVLAAIIAGVAFGLARRAHTPSRSLAGLGALAAIALALSMALGGHAAATTDFTALAIVADGVHVLAAGGWLGSLLVVLLAGIPVAIAGSADDRGRRVADLVARFSPVALGCAALLVLSGIVGAWLHLGSFAALWSSAYGRVLLIKLAIVAAVVLVGAFNWRVMRPALGSEQAAGRLRRSAAAELTLGVLVLLVTAVLVATPPPAEQGGQSASAPAAANPMADVR